MSFDRWMEIMEQEVINTAKLHSLDESFVKTYIDRNVWEDTYLQGTDPVEALQSEMSYMGEDY